MASSAWLVLSVLGKHPSNMKERGELSEQEAGSSKLLEQSWSPLSFCARPGRPCCCCGRLVACDPEQGMKSLDTPDGKAFYLYCLEKRQIAGQVRINIDSLKWSKAN